MRQSVISCLLNPELPNVDGPFIPLFADLRLLFRSGSDSEVRSELELELIQTQMTQKPMLRAEVYAHTMRASR